jgi:hypothetical protein
MFVRCHCIKDDIEKEWISLKTMMQTKKGLKIQNDDIRLPLVKYK